MKAVGLVLLVAVLLTGCTFVVGINGQPYEVSVDYVAPLVSPTEEFATSIFTPVPTTTATPLPTVTPFPCMLTADSNINMRLVPGGTVLFVISAGNVRIPNAQYTWNGLKYYRFDLPVDNQNPHSIGWAGDFFTEQGDCNLPVVNPFPQ